MNKCNYCEHVNVIDKNLGSNSIFDEFYIEQVDGVYRIVCRHEAKYGEGISMTRSINYCPMCGRKLGDSND